MDKYYQKILNFVNICNKCIYKEAQNSKPIFIENFKDYYFYLKNKDFFEEKYSKIYLFGENKDCNSNTNKFPQKSQKNFNNNININNNNRNSGYNYFNNKNYFNDEDEFGKVNTISDLFTTVKYYIILYNKHK